MPKIEISLDIYLLFAIIVMSFAIGFTMRGSQLKVLRKNMVDWEIEMMGNHSELIDLVKEKAILEKKIEGNSVSDVKLKASIKE